MKKIIIVLFLFSLIFLLQSKKEEYIIPPDAIRLRVIASSNTLQDQATKIEIKNNIETILTTDIINSKNKEEAKDVVKEKIPEIENMINHYNLPYKLNFGNNHFPEKTYKGVKYQEGNYESLVVTLGKGAGDNWWCVLYPPLCLLEKNQETTDNVEYSLFVKDIFQKYM